MFIKTLLRHTKSLPIIEQKGLTRQLATDKRIKQTIKRKHNFLPNINKMQRKWITTNDCNVETNYNLVSYNILAQELLVEHMELYTDIPLPILEWEGRLNRLSKEINTLQPDILCVQEMQHEHLTQFVHHIKEQREMEYVYKKKTNHRNDGCAIIYDRKKFKLLAELPLEYFYADNDFLNRGNIAILAKFQVRNEPTKQFIVATTHLLFNPKREDVRIAQAHLLMDVLQKFAQIEQKIIPIILTGDFNSQEFQEASRFIGQPREQLQLQAVNFGENAVSTFQDEWVKVDHIYYSLPLKYSTHNVCIRSILELPIYGQCFRIPNDEIGSDHFSLAIRFSIV